MEELGDVARQRRPARDRPLQAATERRVQLAENELMRERALEAQRGGQRLAALLVPAHLAADAQRPVEDLLLRGRSRLHARENLRVDLLEDARHAADEVRPHLAEIVADLVEVLGERRAEAAVDTDERLESREGVRQRQKQQVHPPLLHRRAALSRLLGGDVIAVRLDHTFGRPCRAGGVDDGRNVVGLGALQALRERARVLGGVVTAEAAQHLPCHHHLRRLRGLVAGHHDDLLQARHLLARLEHLGELGRVLDDDRARARVVHDVRDEIGRIGRIHGHGHTARAEDRKVGLHPLRPACRQQRHRIARLTAERGEPERELADGLTHFTPGQGRPDAMALEHLRRPLGALVHPAPEHRSEGLAHGVIPSFTEGCPTVSFCA